MFEAKGMLFLYVETPLHAGSGTSLGVVDLPLQRERVTNYPMVQSSGIKGKLRAEAVSLGKPDKEIRIVFGPEPGPGASDHAGAFILGDARLLLFPVRSLLGVFAWTTSKDALARFYRDAKMVELPVNDWRLVGPEDENTAFVPPGNEQVADGKVVLEEFAFDVQEDPGVRNIAEWLAANALPQDSEYAYWRDKLPKSLVILPEDAFRDFAQFSTEVINRIRLKPDTKTVEEGALWSEEYLPTDTLLYAPLFATKPRAPQNSTTIKAAQDVLAFVKSLGLDRIQLGGDETVGRGIVKLRFL